ncbi:hypothetical protein ACO22_03474 [Paracoccidioides brasiliensis]|uniref:Uncharacterized protein n=1 Tax=Paracoccidioides brasiliensis TaxID=121759 RepID=A0A1D2JFV5_PARBR|nr:hypothetical protein ACO22_03474 [Paracoccidioides brasiliensis]ODH49472.1 hypothetical protein GX48_04414 [Paracoccidioides brasiliensis]
MSFLDEELLGKDEFSLPSQLDHFSSGVLNASASSMRRIYVKYVGKKRAAASEKQQRIAKEKAVAAAERGAEEAKKQCGN